MKAILNSKFLEDTEKYLQFHTTIFFFTKQKNQTYVPPSFFPTLTGFQYSKVVFSFPVINSDYGFQVDMKQSQKNLSQ